MEEFYETEKPIYTKYKGRLVDVKGSIKHVFQKYQDKTGYLRKENLRQVLHELKLDLSQEEYDDCIRFFKPNISLQELITWWTN